MACESGLSVSVLRFYDGAGVLTPASVDPDTGYRYYAPDQVVVARLVASLRRVGMPLAPAGCPHRGDRTDLGSIMRL
jgi:DNA-binding transcriptional MerR regulator